MPSLTTDITATWLVPPGVYRADFKGWGAGANGLGNTGLRGDDGGGGGAYAEQLGQAVRPGQVWNLNPDAGNGGGASTVALSTTPFTVVVSADSATANTVTAGTAAASIGATKFDGGAGGIHPGTTGGGGGGSAGPGGAGGNAAGQAGGAAGAGGGAAGPNGTTSNVPGVNGNSPGGGAGGAGVKAGGGNHGAGAAGRLTVVWQPLPVPPAANLADPGLL